MPITVVCHKCGTLATVPDSAAGMQGKCERCGNVIHVPGGTKKTCCVCRADVSTAKRTKDESGNYYCVACWAKKALAGTPAAGSGPQVPENSPVAREESPSADAASTAVPVGPAATAIPLADTTGATKPPTGDGKNLVHINCHICEANYPKDALLDCNGDLLCAACAARETLGSISYKLKKTLRAARVLYNCPGCKCDLESSLGEAGKVDSCPQCGTSFTVPGKYESYKSTQAKLAAQATAVKKQAAAAAPTIPTSLPPPLPFVGPGIPPPVPLAGNAAWDQIPVAPPLPAVHSSTEPPGSPAHAKPSKLPPIPLAGLDDDPLETADSEESATPMATFSQTLAPMPGTGQPPVPPPYFTVAPPTVPQIPFGTK